MKLITKIPLFRHKHKWQTRAINRFGLCTYRVCLKCGQAQDLIGDQWSSGKCFPIYIPTDRIPEFDKEYE